MDNKKIDVQDELADSLLDIITDMDTFVGTMLMLTVDQHDPDKNCRELLDFIRANPDAGQDEILIKVDGIIGI